MESTITVGSARALQMIDLNSGQVCEGPRHQYIVTPSIEKGETMIIWTRRLPPADVGDEWADVGLPRWRRLTMAGIGWSGPIGRWVASQETFTPLAYIVRAAADDGRSVEIPCGPITHEWFDVPLPPCPDCGGCLVWYEAGYVSGVRKCMGEQLPGEGLPAYDEDGGCGSLFAIKTLRSVLQSVLRKLPSTPPPSSFKPCARACCGNVVPEDDDYCSWCEERRREQTGGDESRKESVDEQG